jgi:hypothetical protein
LKPRLAALAAVATRAALSKLTPVALVVTRFALGVALLHAILAARRRPLAPPHAGWRLAELPARNADRRTAMRLGRE